MAVLPPASSASFNYFDGFVAAWLLIGLFRGRKRGMTQELLPTVQWVLIVIVAGLFYPALSSVVLQATAGAFSRLWSNITAYLLLAFAVHLGYLWVKQVIGEKLLGSDYFGRWEYYFGMVAGLIRFACMIVVLCALMHSRIYTDAELAAAEKMQQKNFEEVRFPTYGSIQHTALLQSISGRWIVDNLNRVLIISTAPGKKSETLAGKREDTINAILGPVKK